jgi:hypothetical protein
MQTEKKEQPKKGRTYLAKNIKKERVMIDRNGNEIPFENLSDVLRR